MKLLRRFAAVLAASLAVAVSTSISPAAVVPKAPHQESGLNRIELICVDDNATGYGTFQSHNQKVVRNAKGIFMTHIRTRNEAYTAQEWRLSQSRDGGKSFVTLFAATNATSAPALETDAENNLYLARPDYVDGHAYLYRFAAAKDYRAPVITRIPNGSAGKYCLMLDRARKQLYYFAHNNTFHRLALDGTVLSSTNLIAPGGSAVLQYPLLSLDPNGTLHAAWTTQSRERYLYWDIHYLQSRDGGGSWQTMAGRPTPLPVIADQTGPADRITLDDEFDVHTWLANMLVKDGKAHFLYLAQSTPPRQHYVRYDLATARRELDIQPEFKGDRLALRSLDGFFATSASVRGSTLYCISRDAANSRIACLASDDNGTTWYDYAVSDTVISPYSIGGCCEVTPDGLILGSFTDTTATTSTAAGGSKVYFLRIKAGARPRK